MLDLVIHHVSHFHQKAKKPNQDHGFQPQFKKNTLIETTFYAIFSRYYKKGPSKNSRIEK